MAHYLRRLNQQIKDGELHLVASSLAFSTVLSLIPFVAVSLAILQKLGGFETLYPKVESWILSNFSDATGQEGIRLIKAAINRMMSGKLGTIGALFLIITSTRLISDMETGINRVWNIKHKRNLVHRMFSYWFMILTFPFALASYVAMSSAKEYVGVAHDLVLGILLTSMLFVVFKMVPANRVVTKSAFIGALSGTLMAISIHKSFLWASDKIFNYGKLYGGIAAIPLILLWVLLIWYAILLGAVISASLKK